MAIETGEVEVWESVVHNRRRSSVGIVVKTSNYCALLARAPHLADRAEMITRVKIRGTSSNLALRINKRAHRIAGVAEFAFVHSAPDKLPRRCDSPILRFLDDLHHSTQAVVAEFATGIGCDVIDRDQTIGAVPFKCSRSAVVNEAAVRVVGKRAVSTTTLRNNFVYAVRCRCCRSSSNKFRRSIGSDVIAIGVLLDQSVRRCVFQLRAGQLIGVIIAEIESLRRRGKPWIIFCPGQNLTFSVISVIEL